MMYAIFFVNLRIHFVEGGDFVRGVMCLVQSDVTPTKQLCVL